MKAKYILEDGPCKGQAVVLNVDQHGTPPEWIRAVKTPSMPIKVIPIGPHAEQSVFRTYTYRAKLFRNIRAGHEWFKYFYEPD